MVRMGVGEEYRVDVGLAVVELVRSLNLWQETELKQARFVARRKEGFRIESVLYRFFKTIEKSKW